MRHSTAVSDTWEVDAGGTTVRITHPDKVLFPNPAITKRDVARYYLRVADRLMPHLAGRPLVLHRYPDGVEGSSFYQKRAPEERPDWVRTAQLPSPSNDAPIEYVLGDNIATVLWLVNLGAFEMNPWLAVAERPEEPTHLVVDLDPADGAPFVAACRAALLARDALAEQGFRAEPKTSGKSGLHLFASLPDGTTYPAVRARLEEIARGLEDRYPAEFSTEGRVADRHGCIYFDYDQNGYGSTIAAAWSLRPTPTATYSRPLTWAEVERIPDPGSFTLRSVMEAP